MITQEELDKVEKFFSEKFHAHGATPRGVDYNSSEAQEIRFAQIAKLFVSDEKFSLIDYGCGYGAFARFLDTKGYQFTYTGYDPSVSPIQYGHDHRPANRQWKYTCHIDKVGKADYTVACALFNVKLDIDIKKWETFIEITMERMSSLCHKGFAFNMLTKYSDVHCMRSDLYYGDPLYYFDMCKKRYSRNVALLHDYDLFDFTILVRK